ncbi:MAG: hypothetical protein ACRDPT_14725 [Streptomycetales bacterium]
MTAGPATGDERPTCSARGCRADARWVVAWNNPKVHTPERIKTWLACDDHREWLAGFLQARNFLREVVPVAEWRGNESDGRNEHRGD